MPDLDIRIQWDSSDQMFAAVLLREGKEYHLNRALVGMGSTKGQAVDDLVDRARHLVIEGDNLRTDGQISMEDRRWLLSLLH
jgi:hypothetical protein